MKTKPNVEQPAPCQNCKLKEESIQGYISRITELRMQLEAAEATNKNLHAIIRVIRGAWYAMDGVLAMMGEAVGIEDRK